MFIFTCIEQQKNFLFFFQECGHLLSPIKLEMHLFGNEISKEVDGKKSESLQNVSFILHSCLYHEFQLDQLPFPEVIIGKTLIYIKSVNDKTLHKVAVASEIKAKAKESEVLKYKNGNEIKFAGPKNINCGYNNDGDIMLGKEERPKK